MPNAWLCSVPRKHRGCPRLKRSGGGTEVVLNSLDTPVQLLILCTLARAASETMHSKAVAQQAAFNYTSVKNN